jgi:hypothetical protein
MVRREILDAIDKSSDPLTQNELVYKLGALETTLKTEAGSCATNAVRIGLTEYTVDSGSTLSVSTADTMSRIRTRLIDDYGRFIGDLSGKLVNQSDPAEVNAIFDSLKYRIDFILRYTTMMGFNLGYMEGARNDNVKALEVVVHTSDTHDICKQHPRVIDLETANFSQIPPFHANCVCRLRVMR